MTAENFIANFINATDFVTPVDISLDSEFRTIARMGLAGCAGRDRDV